MSRYVLVTGCDSGFGKILVEKLREVGMQVFAGVYLQESIGQYATMEGVFPLQMDVTSDASVAEGFAEMQRVLERERAVLAGVVNNAGVLLGCGPAELMPLSDLQKMLEVNCTGTARVCTAALPLLRRAGGGRIVNISSILSRFGCPLQAYYCASKYAVAGFSDAFRKEVAQFNITVSIVEPGVFPGTGLFRTYSDGIEKLWERATSAQREVYTEKWKQAAQLKSVHALHKYGNSDTTQVPRAIVHAMTATAPLFRYRVGVDSKLIATGPDFMMDAVMADLPATGQDIRRAKYETKLPYLGLAAASLFALAKL